MSTNLSDRAEEAADEAWPFPAPGEIFDEEILLTARVAFAEGYVAAMKRVGELLRAVVNGDV